MDRSLFLKLKAALSEIAEEERKNTFKNKGTIFSNSGFRMHTKSALAYLDNLYKLENIFKNNGNKEALQDIEKEIQSINTQLKNKQSVDLGTPNKITLTAKHSNKNHLNSPTKLATKKSFTLESFNDELEEDIENMKN